LIYAQAHGFSNAADESLPQYRVGTARPKRADRDRSTARAATDKLSAINRWPGATGKFIGLRFIAAIRFVAARMDCSGALAAHCAARKVDWPQTVSSNMARRIRLLAGGNPLAAAATLDNVFRLASAVVLSRVLSAGVCGTNAHRRASLGHFDRLGRAGRLDWPGISPRPFAGRLHHGQPGAYANPLAKRHSRHRHR